MLGNHVTGGDHGYRARFRQSEGEAEFVPRGTSMRVQQTEAFETEVAVRIEQQNVGVFLTDTLDLTEGLSLTVGA